MGVNFDVFDSLLGLGNFYIKGRRMTIEEIIYMARQAGMGYDEDAKVYTANVNDLIDFATNIIRSLKPTMQIELEKMFIEGASFEREKCAKVCEAIGQHNIINQCATAIRERAKP